MGVKGLIHGFLGPIMRMYRIEQGRNIFPIAMRQIGRQYLRHITAAGPNLYDRVLGGNFKEIQSLNRMLKRIAGPINAITPSSGNRPRQGSDLINIVIGSGTTRTRNQAAEAQCPGTDSAASHNLAQELSSFHSARLGTWTPKVKA